MSLSQNLKRLAEEKVGSLYKLAILLNMPQQTVYGWAKGRTNPSYENLEKMCSVLKCTSTELFGF